MEEKKPESRLKAAQYGFLALIFLALTLLLFLGFRTDKALTTSSAKDCIPTGDQSSAFRFGDAAVLHTAGRP